jgi:serine/threonine protein phosphatase PrpC
VPTIELAILSRPGGRPYNEDACGHWHSDRHLCCVVADGAGGHGGGEVASRLAVSHIIERFAGTQLRSADEVRELLLSTNETVILHRADAPELRQMHTTVVSLFLDLHNGEALWGHAGDSRLYLFRDGQMLERTKDHSLVQSLVEAGLLTPEQTRSHPRRSELQSALGTDPSYLRISTVARAWGTRSGDAFLLCTDGLWEYVDESDMAFALRQAEGPVAWLNALEAKVLQSVAASGKSGHDNFSAIAVWARSAD